MPSFWLRPLALPVVAVAVVFSFTSASNTCDSAFRLELHAYSDEERPTVSVDAADKCRACIRCRDKARCKYCHTDNQNTPAGVTGAAFEHAGKECFSTAFDIRRVFRDTRCTGVYVLDELGCEALQIAEDQRPMTPKVVPGFAFVRERQSALTAASRPTHGRVPPLTITAAVVDPPSRVEWTVRRGYLDVGLILTITEMSDHYALWAQDRPRRGVDGTRVPWRGCSADDGQQQCQVGAAQTAAIHIPPDDTEGGNGVFALYELVQGYLGFQAIVMVCIDAEKCFGASRRSGVYVSFAPNPVDSTWGLAAKLGATYFRRNYEPDHRLAGDTSEGRIMRGWASFYESLAPGVWRAAVKALRLCDAHAYAHHRNRAGRSGGRPTPCPLVVGGNSMGGYLAAVAAYDIALGASNRYRDAGDAELRESSLFRQQQRGDAPWEREVRVITVGQPRAGNRAFVHTLNTFYSGASTTRPPLLRVINTLDLAPGFPPARSRYANRALYPVDQGGVVLPLANRIASRQGAFMSLHRQVGLLRCSGRVDVLSPCQTPGCVAQDSLHTRLEIKASMKKHHWARAHIEPALFEMGALAFEHEMEHKQHLSSRCSCASQRASNGQQRVPGAHGAGCHALVSGMHHGVLEAWGSYLGTLCSKGTESGSSGGSSSWSGTGDADAATAYCRSLFDHFEYREKGCRTNSKQRSTSQAGESMKTVDTEPDESGGDSAAASSTCARELEFMGPVRPGAVRELTVDFATLGKGHAFGLSLNSGGEVTAAEGPAARAHFLAGDTITAVSGAGIGDGVDDSAPALAMAREARERQALVTFTVRRGPRLE